jgi:hypothetical protein
MKTVKRSTAIKGYGYLVIKPLIANLGTRIPKVEHLEKCPPYRGEQGTVVFTGEIGTVVSIFNHNCARDTVDFLVMETTDPTNYQVMFRTKLSLFLENCELIVSRG